MASVGALTIDLQAQTASFVADMGKATRALESNTATMNRSLKSLQSGFAGVQNMVGKFAGVLGVSFGIGFLKNVVDTVGGLGELAEQLGVSTNLLQSMQFAAIQAGVSSKELETGIARLTRSIGEAANGEKEFLDTFNGLGIGVLDFNGKVRTTESVLREFAEKLMAIEDPARRAAAAAALMGRGGQRLLPLLSQGAAGIDAFIAAAKEAGMVLDSELLARFDAVGDRLARIGMMLTVETASHLDKWGGAWSKTVDDIIANLSRLQGGLAGIVTKPAGVLDQWTGGALSGLGDFILGRPLRALQDWTGTGAQPPPLRFNEEDPLLHTPGGVNPPSRSGTDSAAKAAESAKKRLDEYIASLKAEEAQLGLNDRAREVAQNLYKAEAITRAGNITLTDAQKASIEQLTGALFDGADAQKRQDEALQSALEGLQIYRDTQAEIANNADLLAALQQGTKEYERQAAYIAILNKYKQAGIEIDDQVKANAREQAEQLGDTRDATDRLKDKYSELGRTAADATRVISTGLEDAILSSAKGVDILRAGMENLARVLFRISVTKPFENWATDLARANSAAGGSSGGGLFGFLGSAFGAIFGVAGGTGGEGFVNSAPAGAALGSVDYPAFAVGGRPPVGRPSIVGEEGAEVFWPDVAGTIIPNDQLRAGGAGGNVYNIDARNADGPGLARLERMLRAMDATFNKRAIGAVTNNRFRDPGLFTA